MENNSVFTRLCWVCLSEQENMQSLLEDTPKIKILNSEPPISLYNLLSYVISPEILFDGGPYLMCNSCLSQACATYRFKNRCETSKTVFQKCGLILCNKPNYTGKSNNEVEVIKEKTANEACNTSLFLKVTDEKSLLDDEFDHKNIKPVLVEKTAIEESFLPEDKSGNLNTLGIDRLSVNGNIEDIRLNDETMSEKDVVVNKGVVICTVCGQTKSKKHFKLHMITHANIRPHACTFCPRRFNAKANLIVHTRIHTKEFPYLCNFCGKTFAQSSTYKVHMRFHDNIRPYKCHLCDYSTRTSSHLQKHIQRHMGNKNHLCEICDYSAYTKAEIKSHSAKHSEDKLHVCKVCEKAFARKKTLKVHERSHSGDKPYVCKLCDKGFTQAHSLRSHIRNIHKLKQT